MGGELAFTKAKPIQALSIKYASAYPLSIPTWEREGRTLDDRELETIKIGLESLKVVVPSGDETTEALARGRPRDRESSLSAELPMKPV